MSNCDHIKITKGYEWIRPYVIFWGERQYRTKYLRSISIEKFKKNHTYEGLLSRTRNGYFDIKLRHKNVLYTLDTLAHEFAHIEMAWDKLSWQKHCIMHSMKTCEIYIEFLLLLSESGYTSIEDEHKQRGKNKTGPQP